MGWAQLTYIALTAPTVGVHMAKHGERRSDSYNVWLALVGTAIGLGILYAGGFFA